MDEIRLSAADELTSTIEKTNKGLATPDRRRFLRPVLLLALALVLIAGGLVAYRVVSAPAYKTSFLLDAADGDLASVVGALSTVVGNSGEQDSQSLRVFGGECGVEDNTEQRVPFETGNREEIIEAARTVRQGAKATLQRGIIEAVNDFGTWLAPEAEQVNRIIVITRHGRDGCDTDDEFVQKEIRERVESAGLRLEFRFVGYQVADAEPLRELTTELGTQDPALTESPEELERVLRWFTTTEPVLRSSQSVVNVLNPTVENLNATTGAIKEGRFDLAGSALAEARSAVVDIQIADLDGRTRSPEAVLLRDLAVRLRSLQTGVVKAADVLLDSARSGRNLAEPLAVYTTAAQSYNDVARTMTEKLTELRKQGPGGS